MTRPFISICIPAYKRISYLERLLESIFIQTFKDYEVIISDDSDDDSVSDFIKKYDDRLPIIYQKNNPSKGTPANWNAATSLATGKWIKLMHDDDWFSSAESLGEFVKLTNTDNKLIFSGYHNSLEESSKSETILISKHRANTFSDDPEVLLLNNLIGPPSVTLIHSSVNEKYDEHLKWRVDTECYVRILKNKSGLAYINKPLINIGISESQVTQSCINNPSVELPEAFVLIKKHGLSSLKSIKIYDQWWRLMRNMKIKTESQLKQYVKEDWPLIIMAIVKDLAAAPNLVFKSGVASKIFMALSYFRNLSKIKKL